MRENAQDVEDLADQLRVERRRHIVKQAAADLDAEFNLLCLTSLYTGMRISEALGAKLGQLALNAGWFYLPKTKNG